VSGHLGCYRDSLHPDESFSCNVTRRVDQADFDRWDEYQQGTEVSVTATATPNVTDLAPVSQTTIVSIPLESRRRLIYSISIIPPTGAAAKAGNVTVHKRCACVGRTTAVMAYEWASRVCCSCAAPYNARPLHNICIYTIYLQSAEGSFIAWTSRRADQKSTLGLPESSNGGDSTSMSHGIAELLLPPH